MWFVSVNRFSFKKCDFIGSAFIILLVGLTKVVEQSGRVPYPIKDFPLFEGQSITHLFESILFLKAV